MSKKSQELSARTLRNKMKSMTGYGCANKSISGFDVAVEVSSVNRKGLDIYVSLPREWQLLERAVIEKSRKLLSRGKVNYAFTVKIEGQGDSDGWNAAGIKQVLDELSQLAQSCNVPFTPDTELLYRIAQTGGQQLRLPPVDDIMEECLSLVEEATMQLDAMRAKEGHSLQLDLESRLDCLSGLTKEIEKESKSTVPDYHELLLSRLKILGTELDLSDERLLKEIAIFADRVDNSEEITRLNSHIDQFRAMMSTEKPVGRPMDFLCQEINREINTVGSKANNANITKHVLEMKNELERVREQVQNVE